jgi:hypothetical protein
MVSQHSTLKAHHMATLPLPIVYFIMIYSWMTSFDVLIWGCITLFTVAIGVPVIGVSLIVGRFLK